MREWIVNIVLAALIYPYVTITLRRLRKIEWMCIDILKKIKEENEK